MKEIIKEYANCVECTIRLKNKRVIVIGYNDGSFGFLFKRLDDTTKSVVLEEKPHERISTLKLMLSTEATKAVVYALNEIIKYKMSSFYTNKLDKLIIKLNYYENNYKIYFYQDTINYFDFSGFKCLWNTNDPLSRISVLLELCIVPIDTLVGTRVMVLNSRNYNDCF
jgi:hypothetical protein